MSTYFFQFRIFLIFFVAKFFGDSFACMSGRVAMSEHKPVFSWS